MSDTEKKPYACEICEKRFSRKYHLNMHNFNHTGKKPCTCRICSKSFPNKYHLNKHTFLHHTGKKPFICRVCNKGFFQKSDFNKHVIIHTGEKCFVCKVCNTSFPTKYTLKKHSKDHFEVESANSAVNNAGVSGKSLINSDNIVRVVEKTHFCKVCNEGFSCESQLKLHRFIHMEVVKPFFCNICNERFLNKSLLAKHSVVHDDKKNHSCAICSKGYTLLERNCSGNVSSDCYC